MRKIGKFVVGFAIVYLGLCAAFVAIMHRPIVFGEVMRHVPGPTMMLVPFKQLWFVARAGRLNVGDQAPDFTLPAADRQSSVSLASFRGKQPVVLVFGSYT